MLMLAVLVVLSAIMSTADTEMFLLSGLSVREWARLGKRHGTMAAEYTSVNRARGVMLMITVSSVIMSVFFSDLVAIYTWLLSSILVVAAPIFVGLFLRFDHRVFSWSVSLSAVLFVALIILDQLTLENAYLIVIPGFATVLALTSWFRNGSRPAA